MPRITIRRAAETSDAERQAKDATGCMDGPSEAAAPRLLRRIVLKLAGKLVTILDPGEQEHGGERPGENETSNGVAQKARATRDPDKPNELSDEIGGEEDGVEGDMQSGSSQTGRRSRRTPTIRSVPPRTAAPSSDSSLATSAAILSSLAD